MAPKPMLGPMTAAASTRHVRPGERDRPLWRGDRRRRRGWPHHDRHHEAESFAHCLALLDEAIARAERWYACRQRELAELERREAEIVGRLRQAGMLSPSMT
jgi:hypothetical protein